MIPTYCPCCGDFGELKLIYNLNKRVYQCLNCEIVFTIEVIDEPLYSKED